MNRKGSGDGCKLFVITLSLGILADSCDALQIQHHRFQMLHSSDHDGMNDRQFFDLPSECNVFLDQLKVLMPEDIHNLKAIFCELRDQHRQSITP